MGQTDRTVALLRRLAKMGENQQHLQDLLAPGRVTVRLGGSVAAEPQAQLVFSFAVNLLARLHPVIQEIEIVAPATAPIAARLPRWSAATLAQHTRLFLQTLSPPLRWSVGEAASAPADCTLVIGSDSLPATNVVFVGSDGWTAIVSPLGPVPTGPQVNSVGAYSAACLGVAEVWKRLLEPRRHLFEGIPIFPLQESLTFSTFTYRLGPAEPNPPLPKSIDLRQLTIVGLGTGGGALAFTLASLHDLHGIFNLIEPDEVVDTNLNRSVYADSEDAERKRPKTEVIRALFHGFPTLEVRPSPISYREALPSLSQEDHRYVVAAVHSREARRELQFETPMVLWDAGATEHGEFFLWRMVLGKTECMHCKHPSGEADPEREKARQLTELLGLGVDWWLRKVRENERFEAEEIATIHAHLAGKEVSFDLPSPGQRYGDWEASQCGHLHLPEADEEIPIPFAPVMAGVLLAGEVIKQHCFPAAVLDSYYWNTLLGRFMIRNQPYRRHPRPECSFCQDEAYLAQHQRRWGSG